MAAIKQVLREKKIENAKFQKKQMWLFLPLLKDKFFRFQGNIFQNGLSFQISLYYKPFTQFGRQKDKNLQFPPTLENQNKEFHRKKIRPLSSIYGIISAGISTQ